MSLSTDLISQFVKTTKDTDNTKKESTLHGTVKKVDTDEATGKITADVELDGSTVSTPMTSTVEVGVDDRVVVMIKDHKATVTGNISNPVIKVKTVQEITGTLKAENAEIKNLVAEKATIKQLEAEQARIGNLEADNAEIKELVAEKATIEQLEAESAKITALQAETAEINTLVSKKASIEQLEAEQARIGTLEAETGKINNLFAEHITANDAEFNSLKAKDAEITGTLTANSAKITSLETETANINTLVSQKASIEQLEAEQARIGVLEAETADINTFMFGSATGDTIQTDFANAVIAQLGDAQIKSAMIEDIVASKITSGEINTNNVHVVSEDGKLTISDETIQISDGTRVRVQIGKDASNDYSINIWDQSGKLMFSEGGITDEAIKSAIIRNDMVSEDANIHAGKLDIGSLFTKINEDGSNTIKSTKVFLDEEKQTLDVAFKEMTTNVTEQGEKIVSQGTAISTIQGQISSKIWQEDINTATGEMSTKYSELEQDLDGFKTTVSDTYATDESVSSRFSTLEQDLDSFKTTVSDTYATNDSVSTKYSTLEQDLDSFKTTVSDTYATNDSVSTKYSTLEQDLNGFKTEVSDTYATNDSVTTKYSTLEQEVDSISATVSSHTTEIAKKADNSTVTTVSDKLSTLEQSLDGFKTTVSETYATNDSVSTLASRVSNNETNISQNSEAIALRATKTEVSIAKEEAISAANNNTSGLLENYSTTTEMNAAIQVNAEGITSSVSKTYATKEALSTTNSNVSTAQAAAEAAQTDIDNLSIGSRNLFGGFGDEEIQLYDYQGVGSFRQFPNLLFDPAEYVGKEFTVSFWAKSPNGTTGLRVYNQNGNPRYFAFMTTLDSDLGNEWEYYSYTFTNTDSGETCDETLKRIEIYAPAQMGVLVKKIKVEMGNKATDWTPAPEDMATSKEVNHAQETANEATTKVLAAETLISQLSTSISMLVTDGNGSSLMTQTAYGWTFSTDSINSLINKASDDLASLTEELGSTKSTVNTLEQAVDDLGEIAEYVTITTYEDEPCIELGEGDSEFKLRITNTRMIFTEGSTVLAYFNNQSLHVEKVVVKQELQQGEFVWKARTNGNLGLVWKGGN